MNRRRRVGHGLVVITLIVVGLSNGCGYSPPPPAAPAPAPAPAAPAVAAPAAPPPPAPMSLADLPALKLEPGKPTAVKVQVTRGAATGPIEVSLVDAPQGLVFKPLTIAADKSDGELGLFALPEKFGDKDESLSAKVVAKAGSSQAEKPLSVTALKVALPTLTVGREVLLSPGVSEIVQVTIQRNGFEGPLELSAENVPAGVAVKPKPLAAGQNATEFEVSASPDAADLKQPIRLAATVAGRPVAVEVAVQVERVPFRVPTFRVVTLKPGEKQRLEVPVERGSYKGPLQVAPVDLPPGVSIQKIEIAPDQKTAALEIVAAENAQERVGSARFQATGGKIARTEPMVIRVRREGEGFLPKDIFDDPTMPLLRRGGFGGRLTAKSKQALLDSYGGTAESEAAVMRGLAWLAAHQQPDGRWSLHAYDADLEGCDCRNKEFEAKALEDDVAGTALGVLPFLGAGVAMDRSPESPPELKTYVRRVKGAIQHLVANQARDKDVNVDGRLSGNMYAHAAATIALCEAYALSGEEWKEKLRVPAQRAIRFIANAQHAKGGWRYAPKQEGDMSAVAWQFLAIRSGQLAGLTIGSDPLTRAERFVDSCAAGPAGHEKSQYSYLAGEGVKGAKISLTAAGLLTRQYLGRWKKDNPDLLAGIQHIMKSLPPEGGAVGALYYYYYATQVLHHMEGSEFDLWNHRMREHLLRTQEKSGHKAGSFSPVGADWGASAGRIYSTSLALMTLEVYYRHLPMYRTATGAKKTADDEGE